MKTKDKIGIALTSIVIVGSFVLAGAFLGYGGKWPWVGVGLILFNLYLTYKLGYVVGDCFVPFPEDEKDEVEAFGKDGDGYVGERGGDRGFRGDGEGEVEKPSLDGYDTEADEEDLLRTIRGSDKGEEEVRGAGEEEGKEEAGEAGASKARA